MKHDLVEQNKKMKIIGLSRSSSTSPSKVVKEMHKLCRELGKWKAKAVGSKAKAANSNKSKRCMWIHKDNGRGLWKRMRGSKMPFTKNGKG